MAPAPAPGHPEDDGEIQAPTPSPTTALLSSSLDSHQNGANPTTQLSLSYGSIPIAPSARQGITSIPYTTDIFGMVVIIVIDGEGNSMYRTSSPAYNDGGAHTSTYLAPTPLAELSSTVTPFKTSAPATNSAVVTPSSTSLSSETGWKFQEKPGPHGPPFPAIIALSIIIPSVILVLSLCTFYFMCIRRKRKTYQDQEVAATVAARRVPEMKDSGVGGGPSMLSTQSLAPELNAVGVLPLASPATTSSAGTATPPVILSTTMNDAYYTGIDTSDHISLNDQRSEASADTFGEEPPPPYRPRSVPPISRETSVRNSMCRNTSVRSNRHDPMSGSNLMRRSVDVRSPFDDPEDSDDDNLSQISTVWSFPRRDTDRLSVVSDMSFQEEPTHSHGGA